MSSENSSKLNSLLTHWPNSSVFTCSYIKTKGISDELLKRYRSSCWLKAVGRGAVARVGDEIDWTGGLYAIQAQLRLPVHAAAKTALELLGAAHFVPTGKGGKVFLFGAPATKLPAWFQSYDWGVSLTYTTPNLFKGPPGVGTVVLERGAYSIRISSRERAMFEVLQLVPNPQEYEEAKLLMDGLRTLRPLLVQSLLETCGSIKVKRLFMHLAVACNHKWVKQLKLDKIDFGKGKRVIAEGGVYDPQYRLSVPEIRSEGT
ncbi:type IV toxin-antitoxin system AbiEi family antitoxin domain-containing protein [Bdellovibrionota bacterium FG-1]